MAVVLSEIHRVSIEEYHRLIESGGLSHDAHVELIDAPRGETIVPRSVAAGDLDTDALFATAFAESV